MICPYCNSKTRNLANVNLNEKPQFYCNGNSDNDHAFYHCPHFTQLSIASLNICIYLYINEDGEYEEPECMGRKITGGNYYLPAHKILNDMILKLDMGPKLFDKETITALVKKAQAVSNF
jgi:hypothetical protein